MRYLFILFIIVACEKPKPPTLVGSWQMVYFNFYLNQTLQATSFVDDVVYYFYPDSLQITEDDNTTTIPYKFVNNQIQPQTGFPFTILQLTDTDLTLSKLSGDVTMNYYFTR